MSDHAAQSKDIRSRHVAHDLEVTSLLSLGFILDTNAQVILCSPLLKASNRIAHKWFLKRCWTVRR